MQRPPSLAPLAQAQVLRSARDELDQPRRRAGDKVEVRSPAASWCSPVAADAAVPGGVALVQFNAAPVYETGASALIDHRAPVAEVTRGGGELMPDPLFANGVDLGAVIIVVPSRCSSPSACSWSRSC